MCALSICSHVLRGQRFSLLSLVWSFQLKQAILTVLTGERLINLTVDTFFSSRPLALSNIR